MGQALIECEFRVGSSELGREGIWKQGIGRMSDFVRVGIEETSVCSLFMNASMMLNQIAK